MRHLPQNALVKAIYTRLNGQITGLNIYDDVPDNATIPYATFGNGKSNNNGAKLLDCTDTTQEIHIFTEYQGRKQLNDFAESIIAKLDGVILDLSADHFAMLRAEVTDYDAYPEDRAGYHGIITVAYKIQYVGGQ